MKTFSNTFSLVLIAVIFLLGAGFIFPAPYDMIPAGDPVLEDLKYVSLESGRSLLSFAPPFAPHEIELFLNGVDTLVLSGPGLEAYNRIRKRLSPSSNLSLGIGNFLFTFGAKAALEGRLRFNEEIDFYGGYPDVPPLFSLPFGFHFADSFQLFFDVNVQTDPIYYGGSTVFSPWFTNNSNSGLFSHNIPPGIDDIDKNYPHRAFIAMGGSWWNFQIGRDRLSYGTGQLGNLAISDNQAFYEFARFSVFSKVFKYSTMISQMPMYVHGIIYDNANGLDPAATDNADLKRTMQRYFYVHRLDVRLFSVLSISLTEGIMVGNSPIELRYLNPIMYFHSLYSRNHYSQWTGSGDINGSIFSSEVNWSATRSFALYAQFVMNQGRSLGEARSSEVQPPDGLGFMAGARFSRSFGNWASIFFLEAVYTYPYLYLNSSPFASFIHMRFLGIGTSRYVYTYTGFQRDMIALTSGADFFRGAALSLSGQFSWFSRGGHDYMWDWEKTREAFEAITPSGIAENRLVASVSARWKPYFFFTLEGGVDAIFAFNNNNEPGRNAIGGQITIRTIFSY